MTDLKVNIVKELRAKGPLTSAQLVTNLGEPLSAVIIALQGLKSTRSVQASSENPAVYSLPLIP